MFRMIEIHSLDETQQGCYVLATYHLEDRTRFFRWQIDQPTLDNFRKAFALGCSLVGEEARFRLSLAEMTGSRTSVLVCINKQNVVRLPFEVSERFQSDCHHLQQISRLQDLDAFDDQRETIHNPEQNKKLRSKGLLAVRLAILCLVSLVGASSFSSIAVPIDAGEEYHVSSPAAEAADLPIEPESPDAQPTGTEAPELPAESEPLDVKPAETDTSEQHIEAESPDRDPVESEAAETSSVKPSEGGFESPTDESCRPAIGHENVEFLGDVPALRRMPAGKTALTFDDGPSRYTTQIVDILEFFGVKGTFFFVGDRVADWRDEVQYASSHGHVIGNHSLSHADLTKLTREQLNQEINKASSIISDATGQEVSLFRPPYGRWDEEVLEILAEQELTLALWNRDPRDWALSSSEILIDRVIQDNPSGGVIILHESKTTVQALPEIIRALMQQGIELVPLWQQPESCF